MVESTGRFSTHKNSKVVSCGFRITTNRVAGERFGPSNYSSRRMDDGV